jgi:LacI family transcriptional regulator
MQRLNMRHVAARAGVSVGTVSNVLNRPELVATTTRERVLAAIDDLGFVPNNAARQLRGIKSPSIALVVLDTDNPFFTEVARGVEQAAAEAHHLVILASSGSVADREDRALRMLEEQRVAGILVSPVSKGNSPRLTAIRRRGTPIVMLDRHRSQRDHCSAAVNDVSGGRLVAQHLVSLGHTRIGFLNGPTTLKPCAERRQGFLGVLGEHGLELAAEDDLEAGTMTIEAGESEARALLGRRRPPTALFCGNDLLAIGAERAAIDLGLRIPEDVAIVGYDDIRFAATSLVPLTSVRIPAYELGYEAAKLLIDEATNPTEHRHTRLRFEPELVVRSSTQPA